MLGRWPSWAVCRCSSCPTISRSGLIAPTGTSQPQPHLSLPGHHYRTAILPTRTRKPRDKAKAEVAVLVVERWILARLRNRRFFSLSQATAELIADLNTRPMRRLGVTRRDLFLELDRPSIEEAVGRALPIRRVALLADPPHYRSASSGSPVWRALLPSWRQTRKVPTSRTPNGSLCCSIVKLPIVTNDGCGRGCVLQSYATRQRSKMSITAPPVVSIVHSSRP